LAVAAGVALRGRDSGGTAAYNVTRGEPV
jgi:hypothetical protein